MSPINQDDENLLTYAEKQLMLYAKGRFSEGDQEDDLKVIAGIQYALDPKMVDFYSVYHLVVALYFTLHEHKYIDLSMQNFILTLFNSKSDKISAVDIIEKMLSSFRSVRSINLQLGEPDFSLLPTDRNK